MDLNPLFILSLVIIAGFGCLFALVFGVFVFFLFKDLLGFTHFLTTELPVPPAEDFLASATLHPWDSSAFGDLSCHWKGDWRDITRLGRYEGYTRGIVKSLRDPDGPGWLAFTIDSNNRKERKGIIRLKTSTQQVELKVSGQRLDLNMNVQAWVDGVEWGSITVTHPATAFKLEPTCLYRSVDRASEARWMPVYRPKGYFIPFKVVNFDPIYYPLTVNNNHPVASLADMWIRIPRAVVHKPFPAALQSVNDELNANEQNILLIMLGMSLYFDSLRTHRLRPDW